jgi:hypothetical protein
LLVWSTAIKVMRVSPSNSRSLQILCIALSISDLRISGFNAHAGSGA